MCAAGAVAVAGTVWSRRRRSKDVLESAPPCSIPESVEEVKESRPTPLLMGGKRILMMKIPKEYRATAVVKVRSDRLDVYYGGVRFGRSHSPEEAVGHGHLSVNRYNIAHVIMHRKPLEVHSSSGGSPQPDESRAVRKAIERVGVDNGFAAVTAIRLGAITVGPHEVILTPRGRIRAINEAA